MGCISLTLEEIATAKTTLSKNADIRRLVDHVTQDSVTFSKNSKFAIPSEAGWWLHLYACDRHGCELVRREADGVLSHFCPVCGKKFESDEIEGSWLQQKHDRAANAARDLAFLDALNPDPSKAAAAIRILNHYSGLYPKKRLFGKWFGKGRMTGTVLNEATWIIPLAMAADMLRSTKRADKKMMRKWFVRLFLPCAELMIVQVQITHNIRCWLNAAIGCIGYLYDDPALIYDAVDGYYGFHKQLEKGVTSDGMWFEGSMGYHFYALQALLILTEAAKRNDNDLSGDKSFGHMLEISSKISMPDGRMPSVNDFAYGRKPPMAIIPTMLLQDLSATDRSLAEKRLDDFVKAPVETLVADASFVTNWGRFLLDLPKALSLKPSEPVPLWGDRTILPEAGLGIIRDKEAKHFIMLKFGAHGGCHGHFDKPGLLYSWNNHDILIDPGTTLYSSPLYQEWYRSTLAHNTFAIDGARQEPSTGRLLREGRNLIAVEASPYNGVKAERTVSLLENGLEDKWKISCEKARRIEIMYHFPPLKDFKSKAISAASITGCDAAYKHLKKQGTIKGSHHLLIFDGFTVSFSFKASSNPVLFCANTPGISGQGRPGLMVMLRFRAKSMKANIRIEMK